MARPILFQRLGRRILNTFFPWAVRRPGGVATREFWLRAFFPWAVRRPGGVTTPEYWGSYPTRHFHEIEPASMALLTEIMALVPDRNTAILDMGCNVGRHLNYLYGQGYRNLHGIDFNTAAIRDMEAHYPKMYKASKIISASFQDFLDANPGPVNLVYTRGATFENVHPSYPLIRRVCAIARRYVVMVIREADHLYPRFWEYEFARAGFELSHLRRPASQETPEHCVSLLTFERLAE